jgi:hypothetical protein
MGEVSIPDSLRLMEYESFQVTISPFVSESNLSCHFNRKQKLYKIEGRRTTRK